MGELGTKNEIEGGGGEAGQALSKEMVVRTVNLCLPQSSRICLFIVKQQKCVAIVKGL